MNGLRPNFPTPSASVPQTCYFAELVVLSGQILLLPGTKDPHFEKPRLCDNYDRLSLAWISPV